MQRKQMYGMLSVQQHFSNITCSTVSNGGFVANSNINFRRPDSLQRCRGMATTTNGYFQTTVIGKLDLYRKVKFGNSREEAE